MISVTSFRVRNLRSIEDSGPIELKPITILVGRNSSGKSTLARVMPLLRQSAEATKRGPILWWGRLVDFGSFAEAVNKFSSDKSVTLDFKIKFDPDDLRTSSRRGLGRLSVFRVLTAGEVDVSIEIRSTEAGSYTSKITTRIFDFHCELALDSHGWIQSIDCGMYAWRPSGKHNVCYAAQDRLLPSHMFFRERDESAGSGWEAFDPFQSELSRAVGRFVHGNTTEHRVRQLATKIPLGWRKDIFSALRQIADPPSFRENLQYSGVDSPAFTKLCDIAFVANVDALIEQLNSALSTFANEVVYLEPLRATAQRYYRQQALAVGEIDSKGENIAMYLDSLTPLQLLNFNQWTAQHFGIEVAPRKEGGHISIGIKQIDGGAIANIADMGFGFSQMLPIAAQLWAASAATSLRIPNRPQSANNPLIVIEQPELHLHPEYQAKLADVFVSSIQRRGDSTDSTDANRSLGNLRILAETHSPALVNRLGALVAKGAVSSDDIQVILLEQEGSDSASTTRLATFDQDGILKNWPIGFFEPSMLS